VEVTLSNPDGSRSNSPATSVKDQVHSQSQAQEEPADPFDYQAAVNELTIQFISEFEETRVSALKWLIMLHQKVPKKVRVPLWHQLTRC
jgi:vacuole morphology and inheritance protein 14